MYYITLMLYIAYIFGILYLYGYDAYKIQEMHIIILLIIHKRTQETLWLLADPCADP